MEPVIRHEANNSYFILKEETISPREEFLLRMITENQIPGLLQATRNQLNAEGEIYYNINGYISFAEYCGKKQLGQQDLKRLLLSLQGILKQMEEYLLDADSLLLEPESLFLSTSKETYAFCLYPFAKKNIRSQIQDLGEYLLNHINHEDEKVVKMTYQFYRMTREENFEIWQVVEELIRETSQPDVEKVPETSWESENKPIQTFQETKLPSNKNLSKEKDSPDETDNQDVQNGKAVCPFFICLSLASFFFFIYTCILKNYYYGYSFLSMLSTKEVQISLVIFAITLVLTGFFLWRILRLDERKGESL